MSLFARLLALSASTAVLPASAGWVWERLDEPSPPSQFGHATAYDRHRGVLIVCSGYTYYTESQGYVIDPSLWEWDGNLWKRIPEATLPQAVSGSAMAFDSKRGVSVLFGGQDRDGTPTDRTFERRDGAWTEIVTNQRPPARNGHAIAFDEGRGVIVMFGGNPWEGLGDTWEYDGADWRLVSTTGPSPRYYCAMAYDSARGKVVLHGGLSGPFERAHSDTWEWDGGAWKKIAAEGPALCQHSLSYDSNRNVSVLFGGGSTYFERSGQTWELNGSAWLQREISGPLPRASHGAAVEPATGHILMFGGRATGRRYRDLWRYDGQTWTNDDPAPPAYRGSSMAFDRARGNIVHFGGTIGYVGSDLALQGTTWIYEAGAGWRQALPLISPPARERASMAYDEAHQQVVLFGGRRPGRSEQWFGLNDTWLWNGSDWRKSNVAGTRPPFAGRIWFDTNRHAVIMLSGRSADPQRWALWTWDGARWSELRSPVPLDSYYYDAAYDRTANVAVFRDSRNGTYTWNGSSWNHVYVADIDQRFSGVFVFDEAAGKIVNYGGLEEFGSSQRDAMVWDGVAWKRLRPQDPGARHSAAETYDPALNRTIVFGGESSAYGGIDFEYYDDTWALHWTP
ncbi:MAG: hypothetical protein H0W86_03195 [Armatimonadetes bacterium]|nr:hypothetical protein [Armatimonadota bacterium]